MDLEDLNINSLILEIKQIKLELQQLGDRLTKLESGERQSGVYLDGCGDYVKNYISTDKDPKKIKKDGE